MQSRSDAPAWPQNRPHLTCAGMEQNGATRMRAINADKLTEFVRDVFVKAGCSEKEGTRLGESLVGANLAGHDSHGVVRVPRYLQWLAEGDFVADRTLQTVVDLPSLAVVDGQYGFGQSMGQQAVDVGIRKAKESGVSVVALRNTGHVGRVGEWAEQAAAANIVSTHYVNAPASLLVAPFGSIDRRYSTAPYAAGTLNGMRNRSFDDGDFYHAARSLLDGFFHAGGYLVGLSITPTNFALTVADDNHRGEAEPSSTFDNRRAPFDFHHLVNQLGLMLRLVFFASSA